MMMMMMMMIQHGCRLIQRTRRLTEEQETTAYAALSQCRAVKTCDRISHFQRQFDLCALKEQSLQYGTFW